MEKTIKLSEFHKQAQNSKDLADRIKLAKQLDNNSELDIKDSIYSGQSNLNKNNSMQEKESGQYAKQAVNNISKSQNQLENKLKLVKYINRIAETLLTLSKNINDSNAQQTANKALKLLASTNLPQDDYGEFGGIEEQYLELLQLKGNNKFTISFGINKIIENLSDFLSELFYGA